MLSSTLRLRSAARLAVFLPLALLAACSDALSTGGDAGTSGTTDSSGTTGSGGATGTGGSTGSGGATGTGGNPGTPDTTAPLVVSTDPVDAATHQSTAVAVSVTFNEAMDTLTLTGETFTLMQGDVAVPGVVTYFDKTATFLPVSPLAIDTTYTATISTDVTDVAGNPLAQKHVWSFTTETTLPLGPSPVFLGASGKYVILAKSAISNVPTSVITGNLGLSPAAASYYTGFGLTKAGTKWTSPQVTGGLFAADNDPPTPSDLTTAVGAMQTAYTDAAGRPNPMFLNLGGGLIGGLTLAPGLYKWTSSVTIPADITLSGAPNDTWIFQVTGNLEMSAAKAMMLSGGAQAKNVFWQVAGFVNLGTSAHAEGILLSKTAIKLGTGASVNGRLLAQTAVTLIKVTVTAPTP